jgi:hypothetical protein
MYEKIGSDHKKKRKKKKKKVDLNIHITSKK